MENIYSKIINHKKTLKEITAIADYTSYDDFYHSILDLRKSVDKQLLSVLDSHVVDMRNRASEIYPKALDLLIALESHHRRYDLDMTAWVKNLKIWRKPVSEEVLNYS